MYVMYMMCILETWKGHVDHPGFRSCNSCRHYYLRTYIYLVSSPMTTYRKSLARDGGKRLKQRVHTVQSRSPGTHLQMHAVKPRILHDKAPLLLDQCFLLSGALTIPTHARIIVLPTAALLVLGYITSLV